MQHCFLLAIDHIHPVLACIRVHDVSKVLDKRNEIETTVPITASYMYIVYSTILLGEVHELTKQIKSRSCISFLCNIYAFF